MNENKFLFGNFLSLIFIFSGLCSTGFLTIHEWIHSLTASLTGCSSLTLGNTTFTFGVGMIFNSWAIQVSPYLIGITFGILSCVVLLISFHDFNMDRSIILIEVVILLLSTFLIISCVIGINMELQNNIINTLFYKLMLMG